MSKSKFIRLRGLPWAVTNKEILNFLSGVNVVNGEDGILMVTNKWDGKNTGEAFIELESEKDEEEAFKHNKEMLGHRYIEIFTASSEEVEHAKKKPATVPCCVVKLRGLPYAIKEEMIEEFFHGLRIKPDREGIHIVMDRRGRASGEAYVQFETAEDTEQAVKRNREKIGHRYIEIFRSSISEMRRQSGNRPAPYDRRDRGSGPRNRSDFGSGRNGRRLRGGNYGSNSRYSNGYESNGNDGGFDDYDNYGKRNIDFTDDIYDGKRYNSDDGFSGSYFDDKGEQDLYCVHMRGLPYYCFENDVNKFFEPLRPVKVNIIYNNKGLHSGSADAFFESNDVALQAMKKHREQMGSRYIELFYDGRTKGVSSRRL